MCLWLNARVVEPGLRPHRDAQYLTTLVWDHAVATRGSSNLVPTWAALSGELPPTRSPCFSAINKTAAPSAPTSSTTELKQRHLPSCGQARRRSPRTRRLRRAVGQDPRRDRLCPVRHRYQVGKIWLSSDLDAPTSAQTSPEPPDTSRQRRGHPGTDAIVGTPLTCTDVARRT